VAPPRGEENVGQRLRVVNPFLQLIVLAFPHRQFLSTILQQPADSTTNPEERT
jgi:hypothetical protein